MSNYLFPEEVIELIRKQAKQLMVEFDVLAMALNNVLSYCVMSAEQFGAALGYTPETKNEEETIKRTNSSPKKKYGMSFHGHRRRTSMHYNYIPRAVRNQPYQRRSY